MNPTEALSPLDGRYLKQTEMLRRYFSEKSLFKYRVKVEAEYLIFLCDTIHKEVSPYMRQILREIANISLEDALKIKEYELQLNHDVKAVEYFIKEKLKGTEIEPLLEMIHFGLTSEDTNNIAFSLMLRDSISEAIIPSLRQISAALYNFAQKHKCVPMLARTHGQAATPSTVGKEFYNFYARLDKQLKKLQDIEIEAKLNGATGNFSAHCAAFPEIDWENFSVNFIAGFNEPSKIKIVPNVITTQILPYDSYIEIFDLLRRVNSILIGMNQDIWRYISDDWFKQKVEVNEVGSSTMPHKVNPINFENGEGMLGVANAFFEHYGRKLMISRLQRDLSDSCVKRTFGDSFGYCLVGYESTLKGISKIEVNEEKIAEELNSHPEIISEAIQTILRKENVKMPYEKLKELTRGKKVSIEEIHMFIDSLDINQELKEKLKQITPMNYYGIADKLVR